MRFSTSIISTITLLLVSAGAVQAQSLSSSVLYVGVGKAINLEADEIDDTPFSIGFMHLAEPGAVNFGFDLGIEGTMLDSTYGGNNLEQAMSANVLVGTNVYRDRNIRGDVAVLAGLREKVADCPDSSVGYQCYADIDPEYDFHFNYGAVVTVSFDAIALGVRVTEKSSQVLIGAQF
ncbi:hypothetical protein [Loktanella sp. S4079]|uniref:hypothetical protein n=1 Tax=Loktanella sp. S4079 TaxID=579483 RepID=UPI000696EBEA|nr:hypothetical protein [Loktanella sp. S4079]